MIRRRYLIDSTPPFFAAATVKSKLPLRPEAAVDTYAARTIGRFPNGSADNRSAFLYLVDSPNKGIGVSTKVHLPMGTILGQYTGRVLTTTPQDSTNSYIITVLGVDTDAPGQSSSRKKKKCNDDPEIPAYWIDASNPNFDQNLTYDSVVQGGITIPPEEQQSNWTRYVNSVSPGDPPTLQNIDFIEVNSRVYLRTTRSIEAGEELLVNYGESFFLVDMNDVVIIEAPHVTEQEQAFLRRRILRVIGIEQRNHPDLDRYVSNPVYTIRFLYECDRRADVGILIMAGAHIQFIGVITVQNWRDVRSRMIQEALDFVYVQRKYLSWSSVVIASFSVFLNDALAQSFGFQPVQFATDLPQSPPMTIYYYRSIPQVEFYNADDTDIRATLAIQDLDCPEIRAYSVGQFFGANPRKGERRTRTAFRLRIGIRQDKTVSAFITKHDGARRYVSFMCAFDVPTSIDNIHVIYFEKALEDYERYIRNQPGGILARVIGLKRRHENILSRLGYRIVLHPPGDIELPPYEDWFYAEKPITQAV